MGEDCRREVLNGCGCTSYYEVTVWSLMRVNRDSGIFGCVEKGDFRRWVKRNDDSAFFIIIINESLFWRLLFKVFDKDRRNRIYFDI